MLCGWILLLRVVLMDMQNALADALIPAGPGQDLRTCINCESLAARVEEALQVSLGLHEPQLVQVLRV